MKTMVEIRPLLVLEEPCLRRLVVGYRSHEKYVVERTVSGQTWVFTLALVPLAQPYVKRFDYLDGETVARYREAAAKGYSFAAYDGAHCVGIALADVQAWNKSLWVWELHVAEAHRGQGIGRRLMEALTERARAAALRTIVCETQNTNVPAIRFYRRLGFTLDGIDLTYYGNDDYPDGEIALFMKKNILPSRDE